MSTKEDRTRLAEAIEALTQLADTLRGPGGCPWDAAQNDNTVKLYLLEEAYEVLDAVDRHGPEAVCSELGDLLFQIVFLAQLAQERGEFNLADVVERIHQKMIRRHPHVFGKEKASRPEEVAKRWAEIKREEGEDNDLGKIPEALPALLRAHRLGERASKLDQGSQSKNPGFDFLAPHIQALKDATLSGKREELASALGGLLFKLAQFSRLWGLNAEELLRQENQKKVNQWQRKLKACE